MSEKAKTIIRIIAEIRKISELLEALPEPSEAEEEAINLLEDAICSLEEIEL